MACNGKKPRPSNCERICWDFVAGGVAESLQEHARALSRAVSMFSLRDGAAAAPALHLH